MILIIITSIAITICLDKWMDAGMILHWWYRLVYKLSNVKLDEKGNIVSSRFFYKPLVGCTICMNVWISIILLFFDYLCPQSIIYLAIIFISNTIIIKWT